MQRHEYKGLRIHVDDNKVIWKISVQLLALLGSVLRAHVCVVSGLLRVFISRRLGAYMRGSRFFSRGWGLRDNCIFRGRGVRVWTRDSDSPLKPKLNLRMGLVTAWSLSFFSIQSLYEKNWDQWFECLWIIAYFLIICNSWLLKTFWFWR